MLCSLAMDSRPVGMFDSGVGGLSVLRHFQRLAPNERVVYFADTAWFPYGPRPAAEVRKRSFAITRRLLEADCKLIVVACNTASAAAIEDLRQARDVAFVGMVPGVKPARAASLSGRVAILATDGTFGGPLYERVVEEFGRGVTIDTVVGTGLAELVERGFTGTPEARDSVREALGPAVNRGADTVVLGCTHYHLLADDILEVYPGLALIDTSEPVARRAVQVLAEAGLVAPADQRGQLDIIVSGERQAFRKTMMHLGFEPAREETCV
jgi:glutamate racemase